jgi:UDP-N-acetylmuramoyl-tripeptide--D-alanyl-D-alanine ligase
MTPPLLTPHWVAQALGISVRAGTSTNTPFQSLTTDSRKIVPGCLFVAIAGENFDGNSFVGQALAQGARGAICRRGAVDAIEISRKYPEAFVFEAADSLAAFRTLAAAWRREFQLPLALVAGSAGKTTTKELLAALLRGAFGEILRTQGSNNGFVGIPLTLMDLSPRHRAAVIEVGIDEPGTMVQHMELVAPDVSVITSIGPEHLEKLIDVDTVAREEGLAFEKTLARPNGRIAVNLDDPRIEPWLQRTPRARRLGFSLLRASAEDILKGTILPAPAPAKDAGPSLLRVEGAGISAEFPLPLPGRHNALNLLGAIATARLLGAEAPAMLKGLASFESPEGRSQVRALKGGIQVLCDYYNSQPPSLTAALELLGELSQRLAPGAPRWACLADMNELGPDELRFHREMAPKILALRIEHVLLHGYKMHALADELKSRGYRGDLRHFESREELAKALAAEATGPSIVLIKGSHSMKMEEVWHRIEAAHP